MAQSPDTHYKLMFGEIAAQLALARAENEELRETIAVLQAKLPRAKPAKP